MQEGKMCDRLRRFSSAQIRDRGEGIAFTIEREDGQALTVSCPIPELGDIFSFLAQAARAAGAARADKRSTAAQPYFAPIPVDGLGFATGRHPGETLIVANLAGFGLALAASSSALAQFGRDLARTAETLSARTDQPH
jgi:hypothetical protein